MSKPINIKNWSKGVNVSVSHTRFTNIDFDQSGVLRPRKTWSTFAGMVWQLWLINKKLTKLGVRGDYTVRLPLKPGKFKGYK